MLFVYLGEGSEERVGGRGQQERVGAHGRGSRCMGLGCSLPEGVSEGLKYDLMNAQN
jgi:hypothetical protein